jgi:hypothetical protein
MSAARDIEEVLRGEGFSGTQSLDPCNYMILHGLHVFKTSAYLEKIYHFF